MSRKKTVYIVRHGQSLDNPLPVFQAYDSPLSDKGKEQTRQIAERASHLNFDTIISSPQSRAKETAEAIALATGKRIEISDLFIERFTPTSLNGVPYADPTAQAVWREWEKSLETPGMKVEDGENFDDIVGRADRALAFLRARDEDSPLVVSHGHFIRTMVARIMLGPNMTRAMLRRFYELTSLENTAITVLQYKDAFEEDFRWRLWTLNDHAHFAE